MGQPTGSHDVLGAQREHDCTISARPPILAEPQTVLILSFNRPDQDLARPVLSRFVISTNKQHTLSE